MGVYTSQYLDAVIKYGDPKVAKSKVQEDRMQYAIGKFIELNIDMTLQTETEINFLYKGETVKFFPFTGWHTGKTIKDGRGLKNLLDQITV